MFLIYNCTGFGNYSVELKEALWTSDKFNNSFHTSPNTQLSV